MDGLIVDGRLDNYHLPRAAHGELLARVGRSGAQGISDGRPAGRKSARTNPPATDGFRAESSGDSGKSSPVP
ncbi:hypothetical protein [Nocardia xishanensis]